MKNKKKNFGYSSNLFLNLYNSLKMKLQKNKKILLKIEELKQKLEDFDSMKKLIN